MMPLRYKDATELEKMTIWWLLFRDWEKSGGQDSASNVQKL